MPNIHKFKRWLKIRKITSGRNITAKFIKITFITIEITAQDQKVCKDKKFCSTTFGSLETIEIPFRILSLQLPERLVKEDMEGKGDGEREGGEKHADPSSENSQIEPSDTENKETWEETGSSWGDTSVVSKNSTSEFSWGDWTSINIKGTGSAETALGSTITWGSGIRGRGSGLSGGLGGAEPVEGEGVHQRDREGYSGDWENHALGELFPKHFCNPLRNAQPDDTVCIYFCQDSQQRYARPCR